MTEPQRERHGNGGFLAFWMTLPGILTGVAAVITAIVGLIKAAVGPRDLHLADDRVGVVVVTIVAIAVSLAEAPE